MLLPHGYTAGRQPSASQKVVSPGEVLCQHLESGLPASRAMRTNCCLIQPVCTAAHAETLHQGCQTQPWPLGHLVTVVYYQVQCQISTYLTASSPRHGNIRQGCHECACLWDKMGEACRPRNLPMRCCPACGQLLVPHRLAVQAQQEAGVLTLSLFRSLPHSVCDLEHRR